MAAIDGAAENGHLDMMQWICEMRGLMPEDRVVQATRGSHLDGMNWILEHHSPSRSTLSSYAPLDAVAATGGIEALDSLLKKRRISPLPLIDIMIEHKHVKILAHIVFIQKQCPVPFILEELVRLQQLCCVYGGIDEDQERPRRLTKR
ncbi:hypothetical protein PC116_g5441 [Phytophthora cactorum]|nr:hypothetical protein Pcac1_g7713 [Phytophthora cactorum]KAG3188038.1 hypothetical protein C6341_g2962 [Phytophthora cactorum]KAG4246813.1 hypothetical protein PC116_g5441 [Phytophthora cactorum]